MGPVEDNQARGDFRETENFAVGGKPVSPVRVPLNEQEKLTDELHMVITDLTSRLESVLTPQPPENETKASGSLVDEGPKSAFTYRVEENNRKIRAAIRKIRGIVERVES